MNILITGASSKIGRAFLSQLTKVAAANGKPIALFLASRDVKSVRGEFPDPSARWLELDLRKSQDEIRAALAGLKIDVCVHLAANTHSKAAADYFVTNLEGTAKLADALWSTGCRDFVFVSSQTAAFGAGAYAESKIKAEQALLEFKWRRLALIRPSELILSGGKEGIDKFIALAKRLRLMPVLVDWPRLLFSPIDVPVFVDYLAKETLLGADGVALSLVRGPRRGLMQMWRELRRLHACLPLPVPVPLLNFMGKILKMLGRPTLLPEQILRLRGDRGQVPRADLRLHEVELPFDFVSQLRGSGVFQLTEGSRGQISTS